jgi:hypothetical protein
MKFVAISLPAIPASPEERQKLRPIGHRTDRWQQMIEENVTLAQMLDGSGLLPAASGAAAAGDFL